MIINLTEKQLDRIIELVELSTKSKDRPLLKWLKLAKENEQRLQQLTLVSLDEVPF